MEYFFFIYTIDYVFYKTVMFVKNRLQLNQVHR